MIATWTAAQVVAHYADTHPDTHPVAADHDKAAFAPGEAWFVFLDSEESSPVRIILPYRETPAEVGTRVGRAIARSVIAEDLPRGWTGIDPQDGDQFTAAGIEPGTPEWAAAEAAAEAEYRRLVS